LNTGQSTANLVMIPPAIYQLSVTASNALILWKMEILQQVFKHNRHWKLGLIDSAVLKSIVLLNSGMIHAMYHYPRLPDLIDA
jgi:hypothetical protein